MQFVVSASAPPNLISHLIVDSGLLPMAIPLVPPLGSTFPTLSGLLILLTEVGHAQSSRLYCLYWLFCTWCSPGSGADQELSIGIGQALPWSCQQEFWFDSSGGWVGCWIAEVLWCQMKLVECFEYVGEQMGGHLEHGKFCLDEDAILKRFWLDLPRCWGHCLLICAMFIVRHTFRASFQENIDWETVVAPSRKDAACL